MELFYGYGLTLLEAVFILTGLLILHSLRKVIGYTPFYCVIGILLAFTQFVGASDLFLNAGLPGLDFQVSSSVLSIPFLAILIVVYATDGTLAAQRLIIGMLVGLGFFMYLSSVTRIQCVWPGYVISQGPSADALSFLLQKSLYYFGAAFLAAGLDLFLLPIIYQRFNNLRVPLFLAVTGSLLLITALDHVVFITISYWGTRQWWEFITNSYLTRFFFVLALSIPTTIYLKRLPLESPGQSRRTLDIIVAFFGAYGQSLRLEQSLRASEERYRLLVQNASDMIIVMDEDWRILDANSAGVEMMGKLHRDLINTSFAEAAGLTGEEARIFSGKLIPGISPPLSRSIIIGSTGRELDLSITSIAYDNAPLLILFGRDITARRKLEKEKEEWNLQTAHFQRLEAIGRLAGGIAHDFNNYLHAIQGHIDIIRYMHNVEDEKVLRSLDKIDNISMLAGKLTSQMLSYARKANYQLAEVNLEELVDSCAELFLPGSAAVTFRKSKDDLPCKVMGDPIQLKQTLMNLMINANDAMRSNPEEKKILEIFIGHVPAPGIELTPPPGVKIDPEKKYVTVRVTDHGPGLEPSVRERIFEPFFTTKPAGEGTGMGLAMAYGTILSHNGWLQCSNVPGKGAAFDVILPLLPSEDEKKG